MRAATDACARPRTTRASPSKAHYATATGGGLGLPLGRMVTFTCYVRTCRDVVLLSDAASDDLVHVRCATPGGRLARGRLKLNRPKFATGIRTHAKSRAVSALSAQGLSVCGMRTTSPRAALRTAYNAAERIGR